MKPKRSTAKIMYRATALRHNQTPAEARLWKILRAHQMAGIHFRRQHAIGNYIVDFCAPSLKLIVEIDGGQYLEQEDYDNQRTAVLESRGYRVIRFSNHDVLKDLDGVARSLLDIINKEEL